MMSREEQDEVMWERWVGKVMLVGGIVEQRERKVDEPRPKSEPQGEFLPFEKQALIVAVDDDNLEGSPTALHRGGRRPR